MVHGPDFSNPRDLILLFFRASGRVFAARSDSLLHSICAYIIMRKSTESLRNFAHSENDTVTSLTIIVIYTNKYDDFRVLYRHYCVLELGISFE